MSLTSQVQEKQLGTPGSGTAFLEQLMPRPVQAKLEGRPQPVLAPSAKPASPAQPNVAEALSMPEVSLPGNTSFESLAGQLGTFTTGEPEPTPEEQAQEQIEAAEASSSPAPPSPAQDDRASPAVSDRPDLVVDVRSGETLSGGDVNFKPRLLRAGIGAYVSGVRGRTMRVRIAIDASGTPISAIVVKSSGSSSVDQLVERSLFEWWFDPEDLEPGELFDFGLRL